MGPRDQIVGATVAVNYETGLPLTVGQQMHMTKIAEAGAALTQAMHDAEGTVQGDEFMSRRMKIAATHLEIALMMARRSALETT